MLGFCGWCGYSQELKDVKEPCTGCGHKTWAVVPPGPFVPSDPTSRVADTLRVFNAAVKRSQDGGK